MARREQFSVDELTLGSGTPLKAYKEYSASITPTVLTGGTVSAQTFTFTGLKVATDKVVNLTPPSAFNAQATLAEAVVSADDTLTIKFLSAAANTPTAGSWKVGIVRS